MESSPNETDRQAGAPAGLFARVLHTFDGVAYLEVRADGTVRTANAALAHRLGSAVRDLVGRDAADLFTAQDATTVRAWAAGGAVPAGPQLLNFVTDTHQPFTLRCLVARHDDGLALAGEADAEGGRVTAEQLIQLNNEFATVTRELTRRSRDLEAVRAELAVALGELQASVRHLQAIHELLPVCLRCGAPRREGGTWEPVLAYLRAQDLFLRHGSCATCAAAAMAADGIEDG